MPLLIFNPNLHHSQPNLHKSATSHLLPKCSNQIEQEKLPLLERNNDNPTRILRNRSCTWATHHQRWKIRTKSYLLAWITRDKFTLACPMISITEEIGNNLHATKTSHKAWAALATLFDSQTVAQGDYLDQQWKTQTCWHTSTLWSNSLTNSPKLENPNLLLSWTAPWSLITSLRHDWEPLVLTLSKDIPTMSTDELHALLLNNDAWRS